MTIKADAVGASKQTSEDSPCLGVDNFIPHRRIIPATQGQWPTKSRDCWRLVGAVEFCWNSFHATVFGSEVCMDAVSSVFEHSRDGFFPINFSHHLLRCGHWQVKKALAAGSTPMLEQRTGRDFLCQLAIVMRLPTSSDMGCRSGMMIG